LRQASGNSKGAAGISAKRAGKTGTARTGTGSRAGSRESDGVFVPDRRAPPAPRAVATGPKLGWREAISATVTGLGLELVDVERGQRGLLRVTIDRVPGRTYALPSDFVLVEDCEQVTRQLQYALEVEGLDYARLEVSSPGLDRPLRSEADFERFVGHLVKITLKLPFQGRKVWEGQLGRDQVGEAEGEGDPAVVSTGGAWNLVFKVGQAEQVLGFKFEEVREARLVPVVDFKGRKSAGQAAATDPADPSSDVTMASGTAGG
jgi:ribosome maturation factor RimP